MAIGLTVDTLFSSAFGATAIFNSLSLFYDQHTLTAALADQFKGSKNTRRPGAYDDDILFHDTDIPFSFGKYRANWHKKSLETSPRLAKWHGVRDSNPRPFGS